MPGHNNIQHQTRCGFFKICLFLIMCSLVLLSLGCKSMPNSRETTVSLNRAIQMAAGNIDKVLASINVVDVASAADSAMQEMESGNTDLETARRRVQNIPQRPVVAVLNFSSASEGLSDHVINLLQLTLAGYDRLIIVERQRLEIIRREEAFQLSGEVSDESALSIGAKLGAKYVITGEIKDMESYYHFSVMALNVETGEVTAPTLLNVVRNDRQVRLFMRTAPTTTPVPASPPVVAKPPPSRRKPTEPSEPSAFKLYSENAYRSSVEYGVNHYVEWNANYTGLYAEPVAVHWTFLPFTSLGLGAGFGYGKTGDGQEIFKGGVTPYAGLVVPINETIKFFGDGFMEVGYNGMGGYFDVPVVSLNPGFDAGMLFSFKNGIGFNLRYKGIWAGDGNYIHSFGITLSEDARRTKSRNNSSTTQFRSRFRVLGIIGGSLLGLCVPGAIYFGSRLSSDPDNATNVVFTSLSSSFGLVGFIFLSVDIIGVLIE